MYQGQAPAEQALNAIAQGQSAVDRDGWPPRRVAGRTAIDESFGLLDRLERSGPAEVDRFLASRVSAYVKHLARHVSAVRDAIARSGAPPRSVPLSAFPLCTRASVRDHLDAQGPLPLPSSHGEAKVHSTSGSTGVPLRFYVSDRANDFNALLYVHDNLRRHGLDPSRGGNFLSGKLPEHKGEHIEHRALGGTFDIGPIRLRKAAGFSVESHADWLRRHPAPYLTVHPRLLAGVLDTWARDGSPAPGIERILTVGETVDAQLRVQARELLGARILDRYSSEEVGPIAFQCPELDDWYHVAIANVVVQIVDEAGQPVPESVQGRVLVTGFNNWATPLLRYELGDVAALHRGCACGAQVPALTGLLGRRRELVRLPNGERRFLRVVASHWLAVGPVREWRITQHEPLALSAEVVCSRPLAPEQRVAAVQMLRDLTDAGFRIEIVECDAIDWGPSYKRQDVVCLV